MFVDFKHLVKEQGGYIQNIDENTKKSNQNTMEGIENLKKAKEYQRFGLN
jgi:t-SNARE complex subunit (syntaxin)